MSKREYFPTQLWVAKLSPSRRARLNRQILREVEQLELDDRAGRDWSRQNYPNGYTSYSSVADLPDRSPTFAELRQWIDREVARYVRVLGIDLGKGKLEMTTCWANRMRRGSTHAAHIHPLAVVSGTYYVAVPRGAPGLRIEDPRLPSFMASPTRPTHETLRPVPGSLILFESWLRHEVPPNTSASERVSVSFNYEWARSSR